ncbi:probable glycosyltransferase At3g07620 [Mercurialis annua]|uniref:probable glycosyltransferase At3g07620 n=1 Tax=Mercurialis annua TaxID=3986 RepID=UPI0024AD7FF0|nr:probable glycosyltransferase At3g07620 [Mercurialis annua]
MEFRFHLCQIETRRWLLVVGAVAITHVLFQFLLLPYGNALRSLLPNSNDPFYDKSSSRVVLTSAKSVMVRNPLTIDASSLSNGSAADVSLIVKDDIVSGGSGDGSGLKRNTGEAENDFVLDDEDVENPIELVVDNVGDVDGFVSDEEDLDNPIELVVDGVVDNDFLKSNGIESNSSIELASETESRIHLDQSLKSKDDMLGGSILNGDTNLIHKVLGHANISLKSPTAQFRLKNASAASKTDSAKPGKKKMKCEMPPKSITSIHEMNQILARHRRSSRAMRPRWSSPRDREILDARTQIENAPVVVNDRDLYAPLFRNVSKFKRSYELMQRILKVYIYKDGKKPIFHLPIMKGLYASEGWFMKLMQGDKHFTVKDPRRAHLFYMPFSSRMLEYTLYVRNSHNRTNLRQYLKEYSEKIAAKYPFWNRTDGADHFLVACHDWAPYETRHHMEHCIKSLCNADVTAGFKIGRDVSLPETYVRSARNPLRDLGGKPPSQRHILAFYAGSMHGYLRPILLNYWKDKDPSVKIFGPMPPGVASKMNYIQHMKSSKYCVCPKGYEVNSPRVVEAIFYECVPVIISDNFVPPFFDVLDWGAFSLILAEKDIPNLKEILLSIPEEKYLEMQLRVRKVQRHFLWHNPPMKYDLFYMTLHSIWYNRVYQIKPR